MENEKKSEMQNGDNRRKRHKPKAKKGYFIEPADPSAKAQVKAHDETKREQKPKAEPKPAEEKSESRSEEKNRTPHGNHKGHNNRRHHGRHKNGGNHPQNKAPEAQKTEVAQAKETAAPAQAPKAMSAEKAAAPQQKNNNNNRNNNNNNNNNSNSNRKKKNNRNNRDRRPIGSSENQLALSIEEKTPLFEEPKATEEATYSIADMTLEEILGETPKTDKAPDEALDENGEPVPTVEVVGIRFKSSGKIYYFDPQGKQYTHGHAIVETARGQEYGEVVFGNRFVKETDTVPPLRPVIRAATDADIAHHKENKEKEDAAFKICNEKIIAHGLDMKLIDVQYTFDNTKLLFYFTSAGRVDFRELVKDLASVFRTRIELRQIGIRDEAKMMGGLGPCGRSLCCSLFLSDFGQVSIKMAKEQNLSLNSSKISGVCGRLMCCLRYEYETYEYEIKRTPPVDSVVKTADGVGVVTEINPLARTVKVRLNDAPDVAPKQYNRDDVTVLQRKQPQSDDEGGNK